MDNSKLSRRDFLKTLGVGVVGGLIVYNLTPLLSKSQGGINAGTVGTPDQAKLPKWVYIVDTEKCIGCGKCVVACKKENKVPWDPEYNRTWVERYVVAENGELYVDSPNGGRDGFPQEPEVVKSRDVSILKSFFVPKLCNQCEKPPCVAVCPVHATYRTPEGVVLVDQQHCIGCRYCVQACPYGARYLLPPSAQTYTGQTKVVDKCTWCYHRITRGLLPACAEVCPRSARVFGDLNDPQSEASRIIKASRFGVLKPNLGTSPKVDYIGLEEGVL
jgi:tetrathionate reductase subunit B